MNVSLTGFPAYVAIIIFLLMFAIVPMYILSKARRKTYEFTRQHDNIIKTEYDPPYKLTPAELGYLVDARFSKREFYATVLDLEQRGYLEISKLPQHNYKLTNRGLNTGTLHKHEQLIVDNFTNTSSLSLQNKSNLKKFKQSVLSSLTSKGLVKNLPANVSFLAGRIVSIFLIMNVLLTILFLFADSDDSLFDVIFFLFLSPLLFSPLTLPLSIALGYVYNKVVGETGLWTKQMKKAWAEVAGYKHFIEQVEIDNIQFESAELKSKTKIKAFPYAVALGLDTSWEDRLNK